MSEPPASSRENPSDQDGPDPGRWWALAVLAAAQLMIVLDASIVNIALPSAQEDLGISNADRQWMVTAYTLAFGACCCWAAGSPTTRAASAPSSSACSASPAPPRSAASPPTRSCCSPRARLQGAFAALMAPAALSIVTVTFTDPKERAKAFGVFGALAGGGAAIGLIVGGVLTEYASWRWCLGVNVPVALIVAAAARPARAREQGSRRHPLRRARRAARDARPVLPRLRLHRGRAGQAPGRPDSTRRSRAGATPSTLTFLVAAVVLLVAFVRWERRAKQPDAAAARRARPQPRRVVPGVPARRCRAVRDVPVPDLLLPGQPGLQPARRPASRSCRSAWASS